MFLNPVCCDKEQKNSFVLEELEMHHFAVEITFSFRVKLKDLWLQVSTKAHSQTQVNSSCALYYYETIITQQKDKTISHTKKKYKGKYAMYMYQLNNSMILSQVLKR